MIELSPKDIDLDDQKVREFERFMKRRREEMGYKDNQTGAARKIGVSQDIISRAESRFTPNMRVGHFALILKLYEVSPNDALAMLGLYDAPIPNQAHREYIEKEIFPLIDDCSMEELRRIRMVIQSMTRPLNNT